MLQGTLQEMTVVQKLKDAGLYKEGDPNDLKNSFVEEDQVYLGDKGPYTRSKVSYYDIKLFADQLEAKIEQLDPLIQAVYAKNAELLVTMMRVVNKETKQGFRGTSGNGNELDFILGAARSFYDPDNSAVARTKWERTISSTGAKWFIEGATASSQLVMAEEEALIVLGLYNQALDPCVDSIQVRKNSNDANVQDVDFDQVQENKGSPLIELRTPFILPPEEQGWIKAYYYQTGTDEMQPISMWIRQAKNLRDLTDLIP